MNKIILLLVTIFLCAFSVNSQDLIESTLKGISQKKSNKVNGVAKSILQKSQFAPKSLFQYAGNDLLGEEKEFLDQVIRLNLDLSSLKSLKSLNKKAAYAIRLEIPVSENKKFHLLLQEVDILEPDYFLETSDGQIIYPDKSKIAFYRGIVEGNNNSVASLTLYNDEVHMLISDDNGNYSLSRDEKRKNTWNFYNDDKLKTNKAFACGTHDGMNLGNPRGSNKGPNTKMNKNIPIYIEVENDIYTAKGSSTANVEAHIMALMNATVTSFTNEQISVSLSNTFIWTNGASTYRKDDLENTLTDFAIRIKDNYIGRLAHYLSSAAVQGGTVGIAWTDVLCATFEPEQSSGPYGVTADINTSELPSYANNSAEVVTFVHELGHNMGSPHTHGCSWGPNNNQAIDMCVAFDDGPCTLVTSPTPDSELGTIMSYCNDAALNKGFGTEPGNLIRNRYNAATCIDASGGDCMAVVTITTATVNSNQLASTSVNTSGMVSINGGVVFSAPNINLNGGFEVPAGNCFEANNTGCAYTGTLDCTGGGGGPTADGTCNAPFIITCGQSFSGNTATGGSNFNDGGDYPATDNIHTINVPANTDITITLSNLNADLDLFAGMACDITQLSLFSGNEATSNETITIDNTPGNAVTYFILVDGYGDAISTYTLSCAN